MTEDKNLKHNYLKTNNLPPPISGGSENDFTYSQHLARLLRRFVRFVVPSQDDISIYDRELLDDVMRYGSLKEIARQRHCCTDTISKRIKHAFKHLETGIMTLEARVRAKQQRIDYLERQLETSKAIIKKQEQQLTDATCINRLLEIKLSDKQAGLDYSVESARQEVLRQAKEKRQRRSELQKNARIKNHFRYE